MTHCINVFQLQQQQNRLMKINHDLRHRITVVEAQGKALIEQKVELEAYLQTKEQEMGNLRAELGKLREKLQGEDSQNGEEIKVRSALNHFLNSLLKSFGPNTKDLFFGYSLVLEDSILCLDVTESNVTYCTVTGKALLGWMMTQWNRPLLPKGGNWSHGRQSGSTG